MEYYVKEMDVTPVVDEFDSKYKDFVLNSKYGVFRFKNDVIVNTMTAWYPDYYLLDFSFIKAGYSSSRPVADWHVDHEFTFFDDDTEGFNVWFPVYQSTDHPITIDALEIPNFEPPMWWLRRVTVVSEEGTKTSVLAWDKPYEATIHNFVPETRNSVLHFHRFCPHRTSSVGTGMRVGFSARFASKKGNLRKEVTADRIKERLSTRDYSFQEENTITSRFYEAVRCHDISLLDQ